MKNWEGSKADQKIDKAKGYKEGSKADMKADKASVKKMNAKKK